MGEMETNEVQLGKGLKQGCVLSPILFALYIKELGEELMMSGEGIKVGDITIPGLFFADDMVVVSESEEGLNRLLGLVGDYGVKWKLKLNGRKSKVLTTHRTKNMGNKWSVNQEWLVEGDDQEVIIEEDDDYKYLGIQVQARGRVFGKHWKTMVQKAKMMEGVVYWESGRTTVQLTHKFPLCWHF